MLILTGIVLYNPDENRLIQNIEAIKDQVDRVLLVDNGSKNIRVVRKMAAEYQCILIENKENLGIAKALNQILEYCINNSYEWLLTLDQDSVALDGFMKENKKIFIKKDIAIIAPQIIDRNDFREAIKAPRDGAFIDECITSGSLMNVNVCKKVGFFDERMFIDYVDFEYCYRIKKAGYKIVQNNASRILHQLGDGTVKKMFSKTFMVANHNEVRHFYLVRNCVYLIKKYGLFKRMCLRIMKELFIVVLYEKEKSTKIKTICKGLLSGIKM